MTNILLAGITGFIGSDLENLKECEDNPRYKFIKGDICNRELVEFIFNEYDINGVIHFAAESHVDNSTKTPSVFIETNVNGTFTLLDVAKHYWMDKPFTYKERFRHTAFKNTRHPQLEGKSNKNITSYKELITFVEDRAGHDRRYAIDATKLETQLGWKADENFESGVVKTVEWYLNKYGKNQ